jgi:hypothetical protein
VRNLEKISARDKLRLLEIDVTSCLRNEEGSVCVLEIANCIWDFVTAVDFRIHELAFCGEATLRIWMTFY